MRNVQAPAGIYLPIMCAGNPFAEEICPPPLWGGPLGAITLGGKPLIDSPVGGKPFGATPFGERGIVPLYIGPPQVTFEAVGNGGAVNG